jgi:hypothetical protein
MRLAMLYFNKKLFLLITLLSVWFVQPSNVAADETTVAENTVEQRLEELARELERRDGDNKKKVEELEAEFDRRDEETKKRVEELEAELEEVRDEQEFGDIEDEVEENHKRYFDIYGFFDLTFFKLFFEDDSAYAAALTGTSSFAMSNVNLYVQSHMTETLSALLEMRLSFLPHGRETNYSTEIDGVSITGAGYERENTQVYDQFTTERYNLGGITMERVHLTYEPLEWLNVIAGRFLTPYGIWNIDHGSPVLLPTKLPYLMLQEMVPHAQTGLQIYGRFFPSDSLYIDYAVTLSNGRGPIEEVVDLDENKGLGLRLKLSYESPSLSVSIGAYGYYGKYTDTAETIVVDTDADTFGIRVDNTEVYDELVGSADLLIRFFGVRLQTEYIRRLVSYETRSLVVGEELFFTTNKVAGTYYTPDYIGNRVYVLLGYTLPLQKWLESVLITPYVIYEYNQPHDTMGLGTSTTIAGGLNVAPSEYLVLKIEAGWVYPETDKFGSDLNAIAAQMAVSF